MVYTLQQGVIKDRISKVSLLLIAALFALVASIGIFSTANAASINGCSFTESGSTWNLDGNCTSVAQINIPAGTILNGNNFTISPNFSKTDESNNSVIGIMGDGVTVNDLVIDGSNGTKLHGINVYLAENVGLIIQQ